MLAGTPWKSLVTSTARVPSGAAARATDDTLLDTHLVLLAESREGDGNLSTLVTRARLDQWRGQPRVSLETLAAHSAGLFALTGCPRGWVPTLVARGANPNAPRLMIGTLKSDDKKLGPDAAESLRDRIAGDVSIRELYVFPKNDINNNLEQSGYFQKSVEIVSTAVDAQERSELIKFAVKAQFGNGTPAAPGATPAGAPAVRPASTGAKVGD